jgi:hypothetical protein
MVPNIRTIPDGHHWQACFEGAYLKSYFGELQLLLGADFHKWSFHILHHNLANRPVELPFLGKGHVLLWFSDESCGSANEASEKFQHVFKCYALSSHTPHNVYPFPLFGASAVLQIDPIDFEDRGCEVFFSGNLNRQRAELFIRLRFPILDTFPLFAMGQTSKYTLSVFSKCLNAAWPISHASSSSFIQFNSGFATGLTHEQYADTLAKSKICLCPAGFITKETMRHFEAMRLGCVVVSETLPSSPYYTASPIIQLQRWRGISKTIKALLSAKDLLAQTSSATYLWWLRNCSPTAMADQTAKILRNSQ